MPSRRWWDGWPCVEVSPRRRGCCSRSCSFGTPAHFWALALKYRDDYAAAGIPMLPVVRGIEETVRQIAAYAMVTVAVTFAMTLTGDVGRFYAAAVLVLGDLRGPCARVDAYPDTTGRDSLLRCGRTCTSCWCSSPLRSTRAVH